MKAITIDYSKSFGYFDQSDLDAFKDSVSSCQEMIYHGNGKGSEYLEWVDLPDNYDVEEFARIQTAAEKIRKHNTSISWPRGMRSTWSTGMTS